MLVFDEGFVQKNPEQAKIQVAHIMNVMNVDDPSHMTSEDPLLEAFASVWHRVAKVSRP